MDLSILIPARQSAYCLAASIRTLTDYLQSSLPQLRYEILVIPNRKAEELEDTTEKIAQELSLQFPAVKVVPYSGPPGKGRATQVGYLHSQGKWILVVDADLPFHLRFVAQTIQKLNSGYDFVTANRRLKETEFRCPVRLLPLVYRRHCYGLMFNWVIRRLFGLKTLDTQAGIKAMSRCFANEAFLKQTSPHFFADIEYFLIAQQNNFRQTELPVEFFLRDEKTTVRLFREFFYSIYRIPILFLRNYFGYYRVPLETLSVSEGRPALVTADDWGLSPGVNEGILDLAQRGLVNRVSILANAPFAEYKARELTQCKGLQLGLHFDLTSCANRFFMFKSSLLLYLANPLVKASAKRKFAHTALGEQLDRLERELKIPVSYFDSHHHIHLLPYIKSGILGPLKERGIQMIRLPYDSRLWRTRKWPLNVLCLMAKRTFQSSGFTVLKCHYPQLNDFKSPENLALTFKRLSNHEIIVHPAKNNDFADIGCSDPYCWQRVIEFAVLNKMGFLLNKSG